MLWRWAAAASLCIPNPLPPVWSVEQSPWHPQFTYCSCGRSPLPSAWWELNHNSWEAAAVQGSGKDRGAPKEPSCARSRCVWEVGSRLRPSFHCWLACGISCLARQLCTCHLRKRKNWEWRRKQTLKNYFSLFLRSGTHPRKLINYSLSLMGRSQGSIAEMQLSGALIWEIFIKVQRSFISLWKTIWW